MTNADEVHDKMSSFKLINNVDIFSVKIYISVLCKHCAISICDKKKNCCSITIDKIISSFSPVLVGSTIGCSIGLNSSVLIWFSELSLSFTVLLGSSTRGFSISSFCESVLTMLSLSCSSNIFVLSLSVFDVGASWTSYWF